MLVDPSRDDGEDFTMTEQPTFFDGGKWIRLMDALRPLDDNRQWPQVTNKLVRSWLDFKASHVMTPSGNPRAKTKKQRELDWHIFFQMARVVNDWAPDYPLGGTVTAIQLELERLDAKDRLINELLGKKVTS
jgi:hypothetical protein